MKVDHKLNKLGSIQLHELPDLASAQLTWANLRAEQGLSLNGKVRLLQQGETNTKLAKNPVPTYALTLAPARTSGHNVCERSTPQCRKACVMWTAGRATWEHVRRARVARTLLLAEHPASFLRLLYEDVVAASRRHAETDFAVRFNVASDIRWERFPWLFKFENMNAYDYTKWTLMDRYPPPNYHLTFSHSERWVDDDVHLAVALERNVAMVFDVPKHQLPDHWQGIEIIDGDVDDYRWADPRGVIVGLAAKGAAKKMPVGGFVTHVQVA